MRVKKYPQSHLMITKGNSKIIIDPGNITFSRGYKVEEFQGADGYLITHTHGDHMDPENILKIVESGKGEVYGNSDVVAKLSQLGVNATSVQNRQKFTIGEYEIETVDLPHCRMQDGSDGPPNTGFLVDGVLFHPGDGDKDPGVKALNMALPIAGPSITMEGALQFAKDVGVKVIIPIHYDFFKNDPEEFRKMAVPLNIEVQVLSYGEETEIS